MPTLAEYEEWLMGAKPNVLHEIRDHEGELTHIRMHMMDAEYDPIVVEFGPERDIIFRCDQLTYVCLTDKQLRFISELVPKAMGIWRSHPTR